MEQHSVSVLATEVSRPLANYDPDLWGKQVFSYTPIDEEASSKLEQEVKELKKVVQEKLWSKPQDPKERLVLIHNIERLGVGYHFKEEVETNLHNFHQKLHHIDDLSDGDLSYVSLCFRLLRQHGFYISCDIFKKFKHEDGSFKENSIDDLQGLINLYEATHLRVDGEKILDEALQFTITHLTSMAMNLNSPLAEHITRTLKIPSHWRASRLESKYYISFYESDPLHDETLLRLAKLDFNLLQLLYRRELIDLTRWSRNLNFSEKLPYVRDREVEAYYWVLGVYYEPNYTFARIILNKLWKILSILDDTYDAYGVIEELELFTEAIQRWDKNYLSQLPDYMKFIYEVTLDTIQDFEQELATEGRSYAAYYMQQEIIAICEAYMQEAKWCHKKYVPTYDEYMRNGLITAGYFFMITASYMGNGEIATTGAFEWIRDESKASKASSVIARLLNDIVSHKFEQSKGQVASAVECYMVQYGVTLEEAYKGLKQQVEKAWKDINEEMIGRNRS